MLPEGGETLERVPLERACHHPSAPKGSCCITRLVVIARAGWVQSTETLEQHMKMFPALRDLCLVSMCVAKPEAPNDGDGNGAFADEGGGGGGEGAAAMYGAAPASPGAVFRSASRRAAAADAKAKATASRGAAGGGGGSSNGSAAGAKKGGLRSLELVGNYGYRKMPELHGLLAQSPNLKMLVCKEIEFDQTHVLGLAEACPKLERVCLLDCNQDGFMGNRGNARSVNAPPPKKKEEDNTPKSTAATKRRGRTRTQRTHTRSASLINQPLVRVCSCFRILLLRFQPTRSTIAITLTRTCCADDWCCPFCTG